MKLNEEKKKDGTTMINREGRKSIKDDDEVVCEVEKEESGQEELID